jgi:hypothetical protein
MLGFATHASALSFTLDQHFGTVAASGDIVVTITNLAAPGTVQVEIDLTALSSPEFINDLYLNTNTAVTWASIDDWNYLLGAHKADGDGFHDLFLDFSESAGSRMEGGSIYTLDLFGIGLDETDFFDLGTMSVKGQFYAVAKINGTGLDGEGSDFVGAIPEPSAVGLYGVGLLLVGTAARRLRS